MKRKSKNKKLTLILVLVLLISVGYAALASNLKINGSSKVNAAKWNVYWDNIQITEGSVPADNDHKARITDSGKTQVEFSIELNEPGDYYEFTVDAVNNGTIDAMIAANGIVNGVYSDSNYTQTATLPDAVSYTVTYADGTEIQDKHLLAKKSGNTATRETYKVRIEYRNDDEIDADDLDENDQTYYFKFSVNYVQADNTVVAVRTDPYSMESMCPGCVFNTSGQIRNAELESETTADFDSLGDNFHGYVLENNIVTRIFACGKENGKTYCLEGGIDESSLDSKPVFENNLDILKHVFDWEEKCADNSSDTSIDCENSEIRVEDNGNVYVNGNDNSGCTCVLDENGYTGSGC